jgi:hypothetical protein
MQYTIPQLLRRKFGRCSTRKQMRVGDWVSITETNYPGTTIGEVKRFYDLVDGGEGVTIGNTSLPVGDIVSVNFPQRP